jgi:hypothetical protein
VWVRAAQRAAAGRAEPRAQRPSIVALQGLAEGRRGDDVARRAGVSAVSQR